MATEDHQDLNKTTTLQTHFDALIELPKGEREAALAALALEAKDREKLAALLRADSTDDTHIARVIESAVAQTTLQHQHGQMIGHWRIARELGAGGMGVVFLVERTQNDVQQRAALKLLRGFPSQDALAHLRRERRVLASLEHPNIARLIDLGETEDGQPYFVMEYIQGVDLLRHAQNHKLDLNARLQLFKSVIDAVAYAHQRLVIHRDLKPSNIWVSEEGVPKLLDFGVAKIVDDAESARETSTRVWTPRYASPEQKAGLAVDTTTDVYALGVVLRELLEAAEQTLDVDLRNVLAQATAQTRSERYPTALALQDDLQRWQQKLPVRATHNTRWYRARKFFSRHWLGSSLTAAALLGIIGFTWQLELARQRAVAAEIKASRADQLSRGTLSFFNNLVGELAPEQTLGKPLSLGEFLARGEKHLGGLKDAASKSRESGTADMLFAQAYLGMLYASYGDQKKALDLIQPSIGALRAQGLDDTPQFMELLKFQCILSFVQASAEQAAQACEDSARAFATASAAQPHSKTLAYEAAGVAGYARYIQGDFAQAAVEFARSEALARSDVRAVDLNFYGADISIYVDSLARLERFDEARAALDRSFLLYQQQGREDSSSLTRLHQARSKLESDLGNYLPALQSIDRALALHQKYVGARGSFYVDLLNQRAVCTSGLDRLLEAKEDLIKAAAENERLGHRVSSIVSVNLAILCENVGDYICAEQRYRSVMNDPEVWGNLVNDQQRNITIQWFRLLSFMGQYAEARAGFAELKQQHCQAENKHALDCFSIRANGVRNELLDGNPAAAFTLLTLAREEAKSLTSYQNELSQAARSALDKQVQAVIDKLALYVALAQSDWATANEAMQSYLKLTLELYGSDSRRARIAKLDRAELSFATGNKTQAKALLNEVLPMLRKELMPTQIDLVRAERLAKTLE
jgi:eukaryotic-like serine/threonine-protein kinase